MTSIARIAERLGVLSKLRESGSAPTVSENEKPKENLPPGDSDRLNSIERRLLRLEGSLSELESLLSVKVKTPMGVRTRLSQLGRHIREKRSFLNQ